MNIILGWIIFMIINSQTGIIPTVIENIAEGYETVQTQLKPGDELLKLDRTRVHTFDDVSLFMGHADGSDIKVTLKRGGEKKVIKLKPIETPYGYKLGVSFRREKATALTAPRYAFYDTVYISKAVMSAIGDLVTGKSGIDTLSGPVEIVSVVGEVTKEKDNPYTAINVLMLFAMITVNLGVFNLLPFPALDGGSIIFALWEFITGKKVRPEAVMAYLCETADENNEMWAQKEVTRENLRYLQSVMYGVEEHLDDINGEIASKLKKWSIDRLSKVDLSILQLAVYEIEYMEDIPEKVSVNEAVNLAKKYGAESAAPFVNGVLGSVIGAKKGESE